MVKFAGSQKIMKRYRRTAASQYFILILIIALIVGFGLLSTLIMERIPFEDHFVIPWAAGRLWLLEGESPYSPSVGILGTNTLAQSDYLASLPTPAVLLDPVINLIFYFPFSLAPYEISRVLWVTLLALSIGLINYLSFKIAGWKTSELELFTGVALTVLWYPSIFAVITGQLSPIVILLILLGINLILIGQDTTAGFIFALCFASLPTTALILMLILVWSIFQRRWSIISAYFSGVAFLLAVTLLMLPSWPLDWLRVLLDTYDNWSWMKTPLMSLAGMLPGIANFLSIFLHSALAIYLLVVWITVKGNSKRVFVWKMLFSLVIAYLFHIQGEIYHLFIILPSEFLIFHSWSERWGIFGRILAWVFMISMIGLSWIVNLPEIQFIQTEPAPLLLIAFPLLVFGGILWIRWWAVKIPRLPYETG